MAAEDVLAEALARLEHKVDLILEFLATTVGPGTQGFLLTQVGDQKHVCPVCTQQVQYMVDIIKKVVIRKCGCATGMIAPFDPTLFAPPLTSPKEISHGEPAQQEDRSDTGGRGQRGHRSR